MERRNFVWFSFDGVRLRVPRIRPITINPPSFWTGFRLQRYVDGVYPYGIHPVYKTTYERRFRHEDGTMHTTDGDCIFCKNGFPVNEGVIFKPMRNKNVRHIVPDGTA